MIDNYKYKRKNEGMYAWSCGAGAEPRELWEVQHAAAGTRAAPGGGGGVDKEIGLLSPCTIRNRKEGCLMKGAMMASASPCPFFCSCLCAEDMLPR